VSDFPSPIFDDRVTHIHATNYAWKLSQHWVSEVSEAFSPLAASLVDRKARLQAELLREYPDRVYLQRDLEAETEAGEPLFGVLLDPPIKHFSDAAHLPVCVARLYLSVDELQKFVRELPIPEPSPELSLEPIPESNSDLNIDPRPESNSDPSLGLSSEPSLEPIADPLEPLPGEGLESGFEPESGSTAVLDVPEPVPEPVPDTSIDAAPTSELPAS